MKIAVAARWQNALAARGGAERIRAILTLALPAAGEQMLSMLLGIVDTFLVGHLGSDPLAAVGISFQWIFMSMVLFGAVGTGSTALIARMVGARNWLDANRMLRQSMFIALLMGIAVTIPLELFAEQLMQIMGAEGEALTLGTVYLRIASSVFIFSAPMFVGNACMRGAGDTRTPLAVMGVVNVLNMAVAWTLINGHFGLPQMGVAGSAVGMMAGRLVGGLLVIGLLIRGRSGLILTMKGFRPDLELMRRLMKVGLPTGLEQLIFRLGQMSFARVVSSLGMAAYAAHQVALNSESLSFMPGFGFAIAATTLVGQNLGAKNRQRAEQDSYTSFYLAALLMTLMGGVFVLFARPLVSFFIDEPEVIAMGTLPLRLVGLAQPFLASTMVFAGALRGAGDTRAPMLINGISIWAVRIPLALVFTQILSWGLAGAWLAMSIDLTVRGSIMYFRFRTGKWQTVEV